jgi:hypothetical protein
VRIGRNRKIHRFGMQDAIVHFGSSVTLAAMNLFAGIRD